MSSSRLFAALFAYSLFAAMAALTLDGKIRLATLVLLAGFALKTVLAWKARP